MIPLFLLTICDKGILGRPYKDRLQTKKSQMNNAVNTLNFYC